MMKEPFASDWVVICTVPLALRTCTVAPAITAPDVSRTVPDTGGREERENRPAESLLVSRVPAPGDSAAVLAPDTDFPCGSVTCPLTLPSAAPDGQAAKKAAKVAAFVQDRSRAVMRTPANSCYALNVHNTTSDTNLQEVLQHILKGREIRMRKTVFQHEMSKTQNFHGARAREEGRPGAAHRLQDGSVVYVPEAAEAAKPSPER